MSQKNRHLIKYISASVDWGLKSIGKYILIKLDNEIIQFGL